MAEKITATLTATEVVFYVYRTGGICGPADVFEVAEGTTLAEVDEMITARRFTRIGEWTTVRSWDGLWLEALITDN